MTEYIQMISRARRTPNLLELTREEAAVLESALFGKIQLCEQNECNIHDWCGVDMWDLLCRLGELTVQGIQQKEDQHGPTHAEPRAN